MFNRIFFKYFKKDIGFTLVELVIVIVIVGILSIIAVPIYRGYTRKAMATEGKALLGAIQRSQRIYYVEFGQFYAAPAVTDFSPILDIDARANKYFRDFSLRVNANEFAASTTGTSGATGIELSVLGYIDKPSTFVDIGLN